MKHSWFLKKKELKMTKCKYCGTTENLTIDHKQPKIKGGTDDVKNLQCLCYPCNSMKSDLSDKRLMALARYFAVTKKFKKIIEKTQKRQDI